MVIVARIEWCYGTQCLPETYRLGETISGDILVSKSAYCTERDGGGDCAVTGGWSWVGIGVCKYKAGIVGQERGCPCTTHGCSSGYCKCGMDGNSDSNYCFTQTTPCSGCGAGQYRYGCGCSLFSGWTCAEGECRPCPVGHYCVGSTFPIAPTPCSAETYQNEEGQATCKTRLCDLNQYNTKYVDPVQAPPNCVPCTPCTLTENIKGGDIQKLRCPRFDAAMGLFRNGSCEPCRICSGKQYAIPTAMEIFCVTDNTQAQCIEQYYNETFTHLLSASDYDTASNFQGQASKIVNQSMPWRAGYKRAEPAFRNSPVLQRRGMLPYYLKCDPSTYPGIGYRPTSNQTIIKDHFDTVMSWSDDCSPLWTRECAPGYFAKIASYTVAGGLVPVLISCERCPPNSEATSGGLVRSCICKPGFATQTALSTKFSAGQFFVNDDSGGNTAACVDCRNGIYWAHSNGEVWQEALKCSSLPVLMVEACKDLEYLDQSTENCTVCAKHNQQQKVPENDRRDCMLCPVGTKYSRNIFFDGSPYECLPCSALSGYYQDVPGQPDCKRKRTNCNVGQSLVPNYDNFRDHVCENCPTECPAGQITIMSSNKVLHNDTCDGNGASFFGCYDGSLDWSGLSFNPGTRLEYEYVSGQAAGARAHTHTCDESLRPPNSDWVTYHKSDVPGAECYFACLHGVNAALSAQLHAATRAHVYSQRQDLINFLVSDISPQSAASSNTAIATTTQASDLRINVDTMWYAGMRQQQTGAATGDVSWTMPSWWTSSSKESGGFLSNTFLFVDDVMRNFNVNGGSQVCLSPEMAYSLECPLGFVRPSTTTWKNDLKCAWHARTNLYYVETLPSYAALITSSNSSSSSSSSSGMIGSHSVACVGAAPGTSQCKQICETENGDLSRFRAGCTVNCMDSHRFSAQYKISKYDPSTTEHKRLSWILYYLDANPWSILGNPYLFSPISPSEQRCSFTCRAPETFLYSTLDHADDEGALNGLSGGSFSACIPCGVAQQICSLFNPPRYVLSGSCTGSTRQLTVGNVCSSCALSKPNAQLIPAGPDYDNWWNRRSNVNDYGAQFTSTGGGSGLGKSWENVLCRYTCNAGYTSVNNGPDFYNSNPCIPCDNALDPTCTQLLDAGVAVFKTSTIVCGAENNFAPYVPKCFACNNNQQEIAEGKYIFHMSNVSSVRNNSSSSEGNQPYNSRAECLAICNPNVYHSIYKRGGPTGGDIFVDYPVPYGRLECSPCTLNPGRPCGGICTFEGYYYRNSSESCIACNTDPCPLPNHYREMCVHGFTRDAQCVPCPESALRNNMAGAELLALAWSQSLLSAARETQNLITRKWVTNANDHMNLGKVVIMRPFPQCKVACVNNYAWINLSTGLSPNTPAAEVSQQLFCIPCLSSYMKSGLVIPSSQNLYSVWNSTNVTTEVPLTLAGSALRYMIDQNVRGGCYTCPGIGLRDVIDSSIEMCEYKSGKTNEYQGQSGTASISVGMSSSEFVLPSDQDFVFVSTNSKRRLLQQNTASSSSVGVIQVKVINVRTHPVISNGDYFYCCLGLPTRLQIQDCQMQLGASLETKKNLEGRAWGTDYCTSIVSASKNRNLLSLSQQLPGDATDNNNNNNNIMISYDDPGTCFSGTYKDGRGNGPCYLCPFGSSTEPPWSGAINPHQCVCMPGYYSIRNESTGLLIHCVPCGRNFFRSILIDHRQNDSACEPCPANSHTPTGTSEYCYCNPGTYKNSTYGSCVACEPGFYCVNELREPCPQNSVSGAGAASRGDCICNRPLFYGDLNASLSECIPSPPGLQCNRSGVVGAMITSCGCALGWREKIVDSFFNQQSNTAVQRIECESTCLPGQYAVLSQEDNSILKCVFCPENSYSSPTQTIQVPGKPHHEQCIQCPPNFYTGGKEGITSIAGCKCNNNGGDGPSAAVGSNNTGCGSCDAGFYLEKGICMTCPSKTTSNAGAVGIQACMCPPGNRAVRVTIITGNATTTTTTPFQYFSLVCEPCPRGYFSHTLGASCTQCGKDMTTMLAGATSLRDCVLNANL